MGIEDRHYVRHDGRSSARGGRAAAAGLKSIGMWSVNTWIIVLCVAVFVVDGFLPPRWVHIGTDWAVPPTEVDETRLARGPLQGTNDPRLARLPILETTSTGTRAVAAEKHMRMGWLASHLHFSTQLGFFRVEFWRLVGFQFLHANMAHLLFNMLGLFFFGSMVEQYLGSKRYLAFYLLCGIFGALMYVLLNVSGWALDAFVGLKNPIPGLIFNDLETPLIGASAGVFGILMAGAYLAPNATVLLFFIIPMRLRTLAYALVALALFTILTGGANAGGEAGHLGGAIAGFYFIRHPRHLHGFFDILGRIDPTSHHYRGGRAPGPARIGRRGPGARGGPDPGEVDRILAKVHAEGLHSLTAREKRILREAAER